MYERHYRLFVSWDDYLHMPELWKHPRFRWQIRPKWTQPSQKGPIAKAKAKGTAPICQPKAMPKATAAAVAASAQPAAVKKEPQDAAVNEELPSPKGKDTHVKQKKTVNKKKKDETGQRHPRRNEKRPTGIRTKGKRTKTPEAKRR